MTTISKERRDEIRAAAEKATPGLWRLLEAVNASGVQRGHEGGFFLKGSSHTQERHDATHIANCDPQTILALLDALDALDAAEAEPVAWMYPDGRAGAAVTMDRKVACDAFPGIASPIPLYAHPPATREGWKPTHWASRCGDRQRNFAPPLPTHRRRVDEPRHEA